MNQAEFTRRHFIQGLAGAAAAMGRIPGVSAAQGKTLELWAAIVHKVSAQGWSAMERHAGMEIAYRTKSARADEAIPA